MCREPVSDDPEVVWNWPGRRRRVEELKEPKLEVEDDVPTHPRGLEVSEEQGLVVEDDVEGECCKDPVPARHTEFPRHV